MYKDPSIEFLEQTPTGPVKEMRATRVHLRKGLTVGALDSIRITGRKAGGVKARTTTFYRILGEQVSN